MAEEPDKAAETPAVENTETPAPAETPEAPAEAPKAAPETPEAAAEAPEAASEAPEAASEAPEAASEAPEAAAEAPAEAEAPPAEPKVEERPAPQPPEAKHYFWGTGRRKSAVARVRIRPGAGAILINKREMEKYFPADKDRNAVRAPLEAVQMLSSWDIWANVKGGGYTGQAGAVKLGLARALAEALPDVERTLRNQGLLTRDPRMSERKKYGQKGARKRFQFSKR